ncbi:MAG TPA: pyridoxamine 5'-phosphate oxidase family protein [Streptosporangiaceae bacterium]|nr:pyridoxamine 5'-phosphate oxidase family protein [Streptosporangiaceae bacterium]
MPGYPTDHAGLETLPMTECLRLLARVPVGRVGFDLDGEVVILPVNHAVDSNGNIVFRSAVGSKLTAAADQETAVFEADEYDPPSRTGWSVVVSGRAETVLDDADVQALEDLGLAPWPNAVDRQYWIRIRPIGISGRRIQPELSSSGSSLPHEHRTATPIGPDNAGLQVFNVLAGEAHHVRPTPFGNVGTVLSGRRMEFVWVSKPAEPADDSWFSMKEVDLIMVIQGQLKLEIDAPGQRDRVLSVGEVLVLPADARCRVSKWPRESDQATIFVAAYPTPERSHADRIAI